ncbi:PPC domain-containing DNA-binding protein [Scleromatobacter humisilvae]|uniref:DNA-binding protein n=1 Tax=Scleromatobacter humisilvae TaxID=2897159 RepID=A0A9X1YH56_9BURK|nr:PPC domain-containing DNA-binding protein [Scleromatobacter humisilvae]MCK9684643.1 DNA-binding protein [Scleromatobacter humisilvae]
MKTLPLRLNPGADLRAALSTALSAFHGEAAFVVSGIGSLCEARIRFAGREDVHCVVGDLELLSLSGTLGAGGPHLHASLADADGRVFGGHVAPGCIVRTTAEILLAVLDELRFTREHDAATGYAELVVRPLS